MTSMRGMLQCHDSLLCHCRINLHDLFPLTVSGESQNFVPTNLLWLTTSLYVNAKLTSQCIRISGKQEEGLRGADLVTSDILPSQSQ